MAVERPTTCKRCYGTGRLLLGGHTLDDANWEHCNVCGGSGTITGSWRDYALELERRAKALCGAVLERDIHSQVIYEDDLGAKAKALRELMEAPNA